MDKQKFIVKVFNVEDGSLFLSAIGRFGTVRNIIEDFSGLNMYTVKVYEINENEESEDK